MQENLRNYNSFYFSTYRVSIKLISLTFWACLLICCGQKNAKQVLPVQNQEKSSESAININTASVKELEKLPHVGPKTALEIIRHREQFGKFRKPEYLILVRGISDKGFREIRNLVKVE
jgi:competence ComEA-like helix-hairpin-helix protein